MTQCELVLEYMRKHGSITSRQAVNELGVHRLAARISDLRRRGYFIRRIMVTAKNRYGKRVSFAEYRLEGTPSVTAARR